MNISQLMRGLLGEVQQDSAKALELKIGQIVRGVILQVLEEQDALVQINGLTVRAKLETAMQPGQTTMLQVQPESGRGLVVLKPVDLPGAALPEETVKDLARMLGLPDKKWAHELVRDLKRDGFPLTREAGAALRQAAAAAMPAGAADEQWMQAAATAFKRGLPMTGGTVGALRQALFGKPAGELLQALGAQLAELAGGAADGQAQAQQGQAGGVGRAAVPEAAARVLALLAEGEALIRGAAGGGTAAGGSSGAAEPGGRASRQQAAGAQAVGAQAGGAQAAGTPGAGAQAAGAQAAGTQTADVQPADTQATLGQRAAAGASTGGQAAAAAGAGAARQTAASSTASGSGQWLGGLLKWLGVDHEKLLAQTLGGARTDEADAAQARGANAEQVGADEQGANRPFSSSTGRFAASGERFVAANASGGLPMLQSEGTISEQAKPAAAESLKSALMSLASAEDVPPAVRETAQQLVNQITGQQLLLSPERNGQLLSQTTLFIPFQGPDGSRTASVHIQSRRGRKGELDADNCRLLFDLQMKRLGDTVVDVHVVNKIVSLSVWNDHPAARAMMETSRRELTDALAGAGFQLLALTVKPMPEPASGQPEDSGSAGAAARLPGTASAYSSKPYKGVDFRV